MSARDHKNQTLTPLIKERIKLSNIDLEDYKIRVPKVQFRFFDKLKNEIKKSILRFCFYFNKEDEIQITDYHFHV